MKTIVMGLLLVMGALAQKIEIESAAAVDFTRFHTFAIRDGRLNSKNPSLNNVSLRQACMVRRVASHRAKI
jgi:hypothetical protein